MSKNPDRIRDNYLQEEARELHSLATELNRLRKAHLRGDRVQPEVRRAFDIIRGIGSGGYERWSDDYHVNL